MAKRVGIFSVMLLVLIFVLSIGIKTAQPKVTVEKDTMHLLNTQVCGHYMLTGDSNKMVCDLTTFSYLIYRMQLDGYEVSSITESSGFIEAYLVKDELAIRLHYDSDGNFMSVCKTYEKSYIPLTYLNEDK